MKCCGMRNGYESEGREERLKNANVLIWNTQKTHPKLINTFYMLFSWQFNLNNTFARIGLWLCCGLFYANKINICKSEFNAFNSLKFRLIRITLSDNIFNDSFRRLTFSSYSSGQWVVCEFEIIIIIVIQNNFNVRIILRLLCLKKIIYGVVS